MQLNVLSAYQYYENSERKPYSGSYYSGIEVIFLYIQYLYFMLKCSHGGAQATPYEKNEIGLQV